MAGSRGRDVAARKEIVPVCRRLYERALIASAEGNVSVRVRPGRLLITPAGVAKGQLRPSEIVELSERGESRGARRPSTESAMHLRIYARHSDVRAVVHAHPAVSTALAVVGEAFDAPVLPEMVVALGPIALVPHAMPAPTPWPTGSSPS